jgi:hypothetical protein
VLVTRYCLVLLAFTAWCTATCTACRYYGTRFRQYTSWDELEKAAERREDADLLGAIGLVRKYKQRTCELVDAIKRAKVGIW